MKRDLRAIIIRIAACTLRRWLYAAAALLAVGLGAGAAMAAPFVVPNPYASGLGDTTIAIRRLLVFGDSYSRLTRKAWHNWAEQLRYDLTNPASTKTLVSLLPGYAVSGATAGTYLGSTNNFASQVTRWRGAALKFVNRDLTVVYLGYNDIKLSLDKGGNDLSKAMADYGIALDRIIVAQAVAGTRRIFLVMPHDWGRSPRYVANGQSGIMRQRTLVWNAYLANRAKQSGLVGIDLLTAMDCVFNQPGDFGFTDVTHARPQGGDPAKYLFDLNDYFHFGERGQSLIRQVIQYYLTRGWDWANTYKVPATARTKLVADLRAGSVFPVACTSLQ